MTDETGKFSAKHVSDSRTEQVQILMSEQINGQSRLFGGKLMEWIDVVAAVVARRHSGCDVTTASVDNLQFRAPAFVNDTLILGGTLTRAGRTSMEVRVDTYVEDLSGERHKINVAYLVMVALDKKGNPTPVPRLILDTDAEAAEWEAAERRQQLRVQRRKERF